MTPLEWRPVPVRDGRLYECPRWIPEAGVFQWVDILRPSIHRWDPSSAEVETRDLDLAYAPAALPLDGDRSVVAGRAELYEYTWSSGALTELGRWDLDDDLRFNDGTIAPDGEVVIGTMSMSRRPDRGTLCRFTGGELVPLVERVGISNGIVWRSAAEALYVDSLRPRVDLLRADVAGGVRRERWAELGEAEPDGLAVDPLGRLWAALWGSAELAVLDGDGVVVDRVPLPRRHVTSLAWGGSAGTTMLVTFDADDDGPAVVLTAHAATPFEG